MARNQAIARFLIEFAETGGQLPGKVKRELDALSQSGSNAGNTLRAKLGDALGKLERREPAMALQSVRYAVADLTASALNSTGPIGRMVSSLGLLAPAGGLTLGIVAGLAGIAIEVRALINLVPELERSLSQGNTAFANMVGGAAAARDKLQDLREEVERLSRPGLLEAALGGVRRTSLIGGLVASDLESFLRTGREARAGTAGEMAQLQERRVRETQRAEETKREQQRAAAAYQAANALRAVQDGLERVRLGAHPTALQLINFNERVSLLHLGLQRLAPAETLRIAGIIKETAAVERANLTAAFREQIARDLTAGPARRLGIGQTRPTIRLGPLGLTPPVGPPPQTMTEEEARRWAEANGLTGPVSDAEFAGRNRLNPLLLLSSLTAFAGAARQGGLGNLLTAGGGVLTAIPGLGLAGPLVGAFGGLVNLFSSGRARFSIASLEREAIEQIRHVLQIPQFYSANVVVAPGTDLRATQQRLARQTRLDTVRRGF